MEVEVSRSSSLDKTRMDTIELVASNADPPKQIQLQEWNINLALDDSGNLLIDVARAGHLMRKVFYKGKSDITASVIPIEPTMECGKVGDGKRKRDTFTDEKKHLAKKQKGAQKWFCFNDLPPELQIRVFEFLTPRDVLSNVARVCKDWANLLTEDSLWHTLHVVHFGRIQRPGKTWRVQCREVMQRISRQEHRTQRKLFFWAARYGYLELVRSTLKQCPSLINRRNKWGIPALCKAAKKGHTEIVEFLLAHPDANVNIETDLHTTALCMVADKGNVEMAKLLLAHGADVNIADNNGRTPLRRAASKGYKRTVQLLAENGADVNTADIFGRTALYRAASKGCLGMLRLLLSLGADVTVQNVDGETPYVIACKMGYQEIAEILRLEMLKVEAAKRRKEEEQRAQDQIDLPPLSPLPPSTFGPSLTTYTSPSSSSYGRSLFHGLHASSPVSIPSRERNGIPPSSSTFMSPSSSSSSPPTSPPSSPPHYMTSRVPRMNPNRADVQQSTSLPYLFINPTSVNPKGGASFVSLPPSSDGTPLSSSPPRALPPPSPSSSPIIPNLLVRRPPAPSYLAPSSAFALSSPVLRIPPVPSTFALSSSSSSASSLSSPSSTAMPLLPPRQNPYNSNSNSNN